MVVTWTDHYYNKITAVYWSDGLNIKKVEEYGKDCDYLQVWYPRNLSDDIYEKYHELITWIEIEAKWKGQATSAWTDLLQSKEEILRTFSKTRRYEVRRAAQRDNLTVDFLCDVNETDLAEFEEYYNIFASQTHELQKLDTGKVRALCDSGKFVLAKIKDADGEVLTMHGYIVDREKQIAALFSSSSWFRDNKEKRALIGRANSLLHYESMLYFKDNDFRIYDFGGVYQGNENLHYKSVANFKLSLGGAIVTFQNGFIIPTKEMRVIERNLCELDQVIRGADLVLWGYSCFGKYVERRLKECFSKRCNYIIDNKICEEGTTCVSEQILEELDPDQVCILVCTNIANYDRIIAQNNIQEFIKKNRVIHLRRQ